jgi:ferritin
MNQTVIEALEKQANHEMFAAESYRALHYWCDTRHYSGYAAFFRKQMQEEFEHAEKILDHLAKRDVLPTLLPISAPAKDFANLVEVARAAYNLERANTAGIHAAYEIALAEKDYGTQILLHWFIAEQVEEEAWSDKMLGKTRAAQCSGALVYLDRHIVKELTGSVDS